MTVPLQQQEGARVAGKKERQRKLARERMQRRAVRQAERDRRLRRWAISGSAAVAVAAIAVVSTFLATRSSGTGAADKAKAAASASATASATATPSPSSSPTPAPVAEPAHHCTYTASGTAARKVSLPTATPDYTVTYRATITTNRGNIVIDLLNSKATCTVNSFVSLAEQKFFNSTPCHRITTSSPLYVLQCGDPTGTGTGGPGYKFDDENLTGATYKAGTVAMANSGPNTNGSQFFLVYKNSTLSPNYTPFGTIVSGLNIIQKVAKGGSDNSNGPGDGHPKQKVEIESVTITKT
jgi:peptidyl-prolyl cis-trans isomerase B (cyclophilin B)